MATTDELCIVQHQQHPHISHPRSSCSSWTCVHDWKLLLWLIHCFSTCSNSVPDLLLFLVPLHSGLLSYRPFTSKAIILSFILPHIPSLYTRVHESHIIHDNVDSYHSKQYQAISRKEATVQVPLSTRTVFSLMIMIMIIEYTTYPILASSTVAMVHPPRGSYEEMLTSVTWTQSKQGRATIFNLFNQRMIEWMMKWCRWIILILCYCMMVLTCDVWWYMICPNTTVACRVSRVCMYYNMSPCWSLSCYFRSVCALIKLSNFPLPFLIVFPDPTKIYLDTNRRQLATYFSNHDSYHDRPSKAIACEGQNIW